MIISLQKVAQEYVQACQLVPDLIKKSGQTQSYFYTGLKLSRNAFAVRLKGNNWTPEQLKQIGILLDNRNPILKKGNIVSSEYPNSSEKRIKLSNADIKGNVNS